MPFCSALPPWGFSMDGSCPFSPSLKGSLANEDCANEVNATQKGYFWEYPFISVLFPFSLHSLCSSSHGILSPALAAPPVWNSQFPPPLSLSSLENFCVFELHPKQNLWGKKKIKPYRNRSSQFPTCSPFKNGDHFPKTFSQPPRATFFFASPVKNSPKSRSVMISRDVKASRRARQGIFGIFAAFLSL